MYLNVTLASQPCSTLGRSRNQAPPLSQAGSWRLRLSGKSKCQTPEVRGGGVERTEFGPQVYEGCMNGLDCFR